MMELLGQALRLLAGAVMGLAGFLVAVPAASAASCVTLEQFGGHGDDAGDNLAAWTAAVQSIGTANGCIELGAGVYRVSGALRLALSADRPQAIAISGKGARITVLKFTGGDNGLAIAMPLISNGLRVAGLTFATTGRGSGTGLAITSPCFGNGPGVGNFGTGPQRLLDDLDFRGAGSLDSPSGLGEQHWAVGLAITNASFFNIRAVTSYGSEGGGGSGIVLAGSGDECPALIFNITGANLQRHREALVYGTGVQGVTIAQSNFVLNTVDVACPPSARNLEQLSISTSQFDTSGTSLDLRCPLNNVIVTGNLFYLEGAATGIALTGGASRVAITGNLFSQQGGSTGTAINAIGPADTGIVSGNVFSRLGTGVVLGPRTRRLTIESDAWPGTETRLRRRSD